MGGGGTDTESVLGWECTWGVEKAQYLQKLCNIKGRSREAGHKRIFTMLLQRGRKKRRCFFCFLASLPGKSLSTLITVYRLKMHWQLLTETEFVMVVTVIPQRQSREGR